MYRYIKTTRFLCHTLNFSYGFGGPTNILLNPGPRAPCYATGWIDDVEADIGNNSLGFGHGDEGSVKIRMECVEAGQSSKWAVAQLG